MANIEAVVFCSLILDLFGAAYGILAFTIPLPLFPRIIEWYTKRESSAPDGFLSHILNFVSGVRAFFIGKVHNSQKWDVVLLGGLMGSMFSTLQFLVAPHIGSLSDTYGRKRILLLTMAGNILSAVVWLQSSTFASYMASRAIGGFSEGNVQLAIAILSDVTPPSKRGAALAQVGIAFAICFIIGPPIGALFASRPVPPSLTTEGYELNIYAVPAFITFVLLSCETLFLAIALPETRGTIIDTSDSEGNQADVKANKHNNNASGEPDVSVLEESVQKRVVLLRTLNNYHFLFLTLFSGMEFTLTFLTFDLFDWDNTANGYLIGSIGIISALLQGGYVRRTMSKIGEGKMARQGVVACTLGLIFLAVLPNFISTKTWLAKRFLYAASVCFAFASATVVNSLTACASLQCDEGVATVNSKGKRLQVSVPNVAKGRALGKFRSSGQLGRAIGPLLACASYWTVGPSLTYAIVALGMFGLSMNMKSLVVKIKEA